MPITAIVVNDSAKRVFCPATALGVHTVIDLQPDEVWYSSLPDFVHAALAAETSLLKADCTVRFSVDGAVEVELSAEPAPEAQESAPSAPTKTEA